MRLFTAAVALCIMLLSGTSLAQPTSLSAHQVPNQTPELGAGAPAPINVACAANIGQVATSATLCASFEINMQGFTEATLIVEYTRATASAIHIFTDGSMGTAATSATRPKILAGDIPWGQVMLGDAAVHPVVTMAPEDVEILVAANGVFEIAFDKLNTPFVRWRFEGTGAAVGDTVRVWVTKRGPSK